MGSGAVFDFVAQDEPGAGVAGCGGREVLAELVDGRGGPCRGEWVQTDREVSGGGGVDVAVAGERLPCQCVGFLGGPGVAGVGPDFPGEGRGGVESGHPDRVGKQFRLGVQDLLAG